MTTTNDPRPYALISELAAELAHIERDDRPNRRYLSLTEAAQLARDLAADLEQWAAAGGVSIDNIMSVSDAATDIRAAVRRAALDDKD